MQETIEIEDIEEMRRQEGIDDVELREAIRKLRSGDFVRLTFLKAPKSYETVLVRITSIQGAAFVGKVANRPASHGLAKLRVGYAVAFTAAHIHSLPKEQPAHEHS